MLVTEYSLKVELKASADKLEVECDRMEEYWASYGLSLGSFNNGVDIF